MKKLSIGLTSIVTVKKMKRWGREWMLIDILNFPNIAWNDNLKIISVFWKLISVVNGKQKVNNLQLLETSELVGWSLKDEKLLLVRTSLMVSEDKVEKDKEW